MTARDELEERMAEWNAMPPMTAAEQADLARRLERLSDGEVVELLAQALRRRRNRAGDR
jgi:hypothetical protein